MILLGKQDGKLLFLYFLKRNFFLANKEYKW